MHKLVVSMVLLAVPVIGEHPLDEEELNDEMFIHATLPCLMNTLVVSLMKSHSDTTITVSKFIATLALKKGMNELLDSSHEEMKVQTKLGMRALGIESLRNEPKTMRSKVYAAAISSCLSTCSGRKIPVENFLEGHYVRLMSEVGKTD